MPIPFYMLVTWSFTHWEGLIQIHGKSCKLTQIWQLCKILQIAPNPQRLISTSNRLRKPAREQLASGEQLCRQQPRLAGSIRNRLADLYGTPSYRSPPFRHKGKECDYTTFANNRIIVQTHLAWIHAEIYCIFLRECHNTWHSSQYMSQYMAYIYNVQEGLSQAGQPNPHIQNCKKSLGRKENSTAKHVTSRGPQARQRYCNLRFILRIRCSPFSWQNLATHPSLLRNAGQNFAKTT